MLPLLPSYLESGDYFSLMHFSSLQFTHPCPYTGAWQSASVSIIFLLLHHRIRLPAFRSSCASSISMLSCWIVFPLDSSVIWSRKDKSTSFNPISENLRASFSLIVVRGVMSSFIPHFSSRFLRSSSMFLIFLLHYGNASSCIKIICLTAILAHPSILELVCIFLLEILSSAHMAVCWRINPEIRDFCECHLLPRFFFLFLL